MRTKSIGELLKAEREKFQVSLEELAKRSKIRKKYLEALEKNDFIDLPGATFVKGYIKTYARIFAFDHRPLLAILRRDYKESSKGKLVPQEFILPKSKQGLHPGVSASLLTIGALFITLLVYVIVQWYNLQKPPFLELVQPQEDSTVAARTLVVGMVEADANLRVNAELVEVANDGSFQKELFFTREGLQSITVEAIGRRGKSNVIRRTVKVEF